VILKTMIAKNDRKTGLGTGLELGIKGDFREIQAQNQLFEGITHKDSHSAGVLSAIRDFYERQRT
jgi:hypothetical protein